MNATIWILLCLFASIGVVQCIGWLIMRRGRMSKQRRGYHIIPLYDGPEQLEAQLRHCMTQICWEEGGYSGEIVLLVDMGMGAESLGICEEWMKNQGVLFYCTADELTETLRSLDSLQIL